MRLIRQVTAVVMVAAVFSLVHGFLLKQAGELGATDEMAINLPDAEALDGALWIDARSYEAFSAGHYPEAILLNEDDWEAGFGALIMEWDPLKPIVVYCDGGGCASSRQVAERLEQELGIERVYWLIDGWEAIQGAGIAQ